MEKQNISPDRITKPIQLLGAWLVGLLTVDSAFLAAATNMDLNSWQSLALTIAAILNVPIFIGALFLLQTKFRPELQEDSYYSTYLNNRTNEVMKVSKAEIIQDQLLAKVTAIEKQLEKKETVIINESSAAVISTGDFESSPLSKLSYAVNMNLENQSAIEDRLDELGIKIIRTFGQHSTKPDKLTVGVAEHLPKAAIDEVILMAKELGFEYYSYIESFEDIDEDVLFGAYGEIAGKITLKSVKSK